MSAVDDCSFGVVILAAGASRRMGSPKALLRWGEGTVLEHVVGVWKEAGAEQVAVVFDPGNLAVVGELDRLGIAERIVNERAAEGMMSSLQAAGGWEGWEVDWVAVALVDQPGVSVKLVRELAEFARGSGGEICQPVCGGRRGHPVFFLREVFEELAGTGDETLKVFMAKREGLRKVMEWGNEVVFEDMDTPEDYLRLRRGKEEPRMDTN